MGSYATQLNKALMPLENRAIITHIIERFPVETEFVIGLGHRGDQVRQYLGIAHSDRRFIFVEIDNYEGPGSGPGYSLLCCRPHLERPFYFVSCDTLWEGALPTLNTQNWLGVAPVAAAETARYCTLRVDWPRITDLRDKELVDDPAYEAFVGLCFIYDHAIFWQAFADTVTVEGERQVSNGLRALIAQTAVRAETIAWTDVGDFDRYRRAVLLVSDFDFSKSDEFFFAVGSKVIKYFVDPTITDRRVKKAALNRGAFPTITDHAGGFYAYTFQPGETLYERNSPATFHSLLEWLETEVWQKVDVDPAVMKQACRSFYRDKTLARLAEYERKYPVPAQPTIVNGTALPPLADLLERLPWSLLEDGLPRFMHGDLQFDNILHDPVTNRFTLLDWRQDFAGNIAFGDIYYDLAKLRGGIILNYDYIKQNLLRYDEAPGAELRAEFDFAQRFRTGQYLKILDDYVVARGLSVEKVRLLVAVIYLNMAPLHHFPFDKMLHALGHDMLAAELVAQVA